MSSPAPLKQAAALQVSRRHKPWTVNNAPARAEKPGLRAIPLTRRYQVLWADEDGHIDDFVRIGPAMPIFEEAFSAFAHGALVQTTEGPVAVEDLLPGMAVETATGRIEPLRWIGSITLVPGAPRTGNLPQRLYRVTPDYFGLGRPATDVTLGPAARLLNRDPAIRAALGSEAALAPVADFVDGTGVVQINPVSPTRVYHLAFDGHHVIRVGGLEVESYHPGSDAQYSLSQELREVFLSLFPHVATLQGFGRELWPRFETQDDGEIELL